MVQELVIMRAPSAAGKSTYAKRWAQSGLDRVRVSRDDIRLSMFGTMWGVDEDAVTAIEDATIRAALSTGKSVVVDDTNIVPRFIHRLANIGFQYGAEVRVEQIDVPLETALRQNNERKAGGGRHVPEDVIRKMYDRLKQNPIIKLNLPVIETYIPDKSLREAYLFDIDGTLARMEGRGPYDWARVGEDSIVQSVADVANNLFGENQIILFSGRDEAAMEETLMWLMSNNVSFDQLHMRPKDDRRSDTIVKYEMFNKHARNVYNVKGVFDDRYSVVRMWKTLGLTVFNVSGLDDGHF